MDASTTITSAITTSNYPALHTFFTATHPTLNAGEQRTISAHFIVTAVSSNFFPDAFKSPVIQKVVEVALANLPTVVEGAADNKLRQLLFEFKVEEGDYAGAAGILAAMRMEENENSVYYMKPLDKCDVYVKVAECYLEEELTVEAEGAVGKAGSVIETNGISFPSKDTNDEDSIRPKISNEEQERTITLLLRYKSTHARILDANRKFLQAAMKYYDLSTAYLHTDKIDADDLMIMLGKAVTCAILSPNSAQRQRLVSF
jgi:COP9 signalosome complex subunit 4